MKIRVGNKMNSFLNGEWAGHGRPWGKKIAAKKRRKIGRIFIKNELKNNTK